MFTSKSAPDIFDAAIAGALCLIVVSVGIACLGCYLILAYARG